MALSMYELSGLSVDGAGSRAEFQGGQLLPFTGFFSDFIAFDDDPFIFGPTEKGDDPTIFASISSFNPDTSIFDLEPAGATLFELDLSSAELGTIRVSGTDQRIAAIQFSQPHPTKQGVELRHFLTAFGSAITVDAGSFEADPTDAVAKWSEFFRAPIPGTDGDDTLTGTSASERLFGFGGNDKIAPLDGKDYADGGAGVDIIDFRGSSVAGLTLNLPETGVNGFVANKVFINFEKYSCTDFDDIVFGSSVKDIVMGNGGGDNIRGGLGNDLLRGGAGDDRLFGDGDNDILDGGSGDDDLTGGDGVDQFRFVKRFGLDDIKDWEDGTDIIAFVEKGVEFRDLVITDSDFGAVISIRGMAGLGQVTVQGVLAESLTRSDFDFN